MEKLRPDQLREKANMLPLLPGVYIMLDEHGEVIYIGKAKALKNRVTSYFRGEHLPKVAAMVAHVADFNVIVVQSEFEALVLENSLIKLHKPKYNILLKDDKGYPFVRLDVTQPYPTFSLVNHTEKDGAKYFGPYGGRSMTAEIIDTVCKTLRLPTCTRRFPRDIGRARPCLNYHMGTCAGYCLKDVTRAQYLQAIREAEMILDGRTAELTAELTEQMQAAAEALFGGGSDFSSMPTVALTQEQIDGGGLRIPDLLVLAGLAKSKSDARRLITDGAVFVGERRVASHEETLSAADLDGEGVIVRKGKKSFCRMKRA